MRLTLAMLGWASGALLLAQLAPAAASAQTVDPGERTANDLQPPAEVMDAVGIKPGMVIGEIGAGRGRYTIFLAKRVGEAGKIYANDIDATALAYLRERCQRDGIDHFEGRTYPGWQHHLVISAVAYAFLQQERMRPPVDPALTFPAIRAIVQEVFTGLLFASRPRYLEWMHQAKQRLEQLRI